MLVVLHVMEVMLRERTVDGVLGRVGDLADDSLVGLVDVGGRHDVGCVWGLLVWFG